MIRDESKSRRQLQAGSKWRVTSAWLFHSGWAEKETRASEEEGGGWVHLLLLPGVALLSFQDPLKSFLASQTGYHELSGFGECPGNIPG